MKRRILSSLMALVLVFGLLPATAFAEEGTTPAGKTIYVDAVKGDDMQADVGTAAGNDAADGNKCRQHSRYYAVRLCQPGDHAELSGGRRQPWYVQSVRLTRRRTRKTGNSCSFAGTRSVQTISR